MDEDAQFGMIASIEAHLEEVRRLEKFLDDENTVEAARAVISAQKETIGVLAQLLDALTQGTGVN